MENENEKDNYNIIIIGNYKEEDKKIIIELSKKIRIKT